MRGKPRARELLNSDKVKELAKIHSYVDAFEMVWPHLMRQERLRFSKKERIKRRAKLAPRSIPPSWANPVKTKEEKDAEDHS